MKITVLLTILLTNLAMSQSIFRIEIGDDYKNHSNKELKRRIWRLERAVAQLQDKVFDLQTQGSRSQKTWICTLSAMGENYSAAGETKAIAKAKVLKECSKKGDSFFCKNPKCEQ